MRWSAGRPQNKEMAEVPCQPSKTYTHAHARGQAAVLGKGAFIFHRNVNTVIHNLHLYAQQDFAKNWENAHVNYRCLFDVTIVNVCHAKMCFLPHCINSDPQ